MSVSIKTIQDTKLSALIKSTFHLTPAEETIIDRCQQLSYTTWVGFYDEKLVCAWGIVPPSILSDSVYLWLHTTPIVAECQFLFIRRSQLFVEELLKEYHQIIGHVKKDEMKSQRWLKWLGAEFSPSTKEGMLSFRIKRKWQTL